MTAASYKQHRIGSNYKIYGYMALGLATAIAFRLLIIIDHIEPGWVRPVWYFGVLGNFVFFHYRFKITRKRKQVIRDNRLIQKIESCNELTEKERGALTYLLSSIDRSPESFNYLIISIFSVLAIAIDIGMSHFY
jgi:hypothetical protein